MSTAQPSRTVLLTAFFSAKGGVGKSALATAYALAKAAAGGSPVLIDADLTGTSLADGLKLRAPVLPQQANGMLDLRSKPDEYHSIDQTRMQRAKRRTHPAAPHRPRWIPFLNDALSTGDEDRSGFCADSLLWVDDVGTSVRYIPSSPIPADVSLAVRWLYSEEETSRWAVRFARVIVTLVSELPQLDEIVIDLPPGLFGFTHSVLSLLAHLARRTPLPSSFPHLLSADQPQWKVKAFLITSSDRNDIAVSMDYFAEITLRNSALAVVPVVNRLVLSLETVKLEVRQLFPQLGLQERLRSIPFEAETLGKIFVHGDLRMNEQITHSLRALLKEDP